jgi:hypothetical protein
MLLKQNIKSNTIEALKLGDQFLVGTLRMLLASITTKEKEKRYKISKEKPKATEEILSKESELTDEQIIDVIASEIKKRKDAIVLYEKGNRPELADREKKEIEILKKYLPEQLSEDAIKKLVQESITKVKAEMKDPSASSGQAMGKVMADLNPKVKGKADGGEVSKIVKELLSK